MRSILKIILYLFSLNLIQAQVFGVETIKTEGDNDKRLNLIIISEGYQESEFDKFKTDAESIVSDMFTQSPFSEYSNYFNVHIIKVPSNESGADHPGTAAGESGITPVTKDTYFNATFDAWGYHRYLYYGLNYTDAIPADAKINSVLADNFPTYDQALLLVNSSEYGGTGGEFPMSSASAQANELAIHELGHSMFDLKDEYLLPDVYYAEAINMTQETDPNTIKWKNWLNDNDIGIYPYGTSGVPATWYKPKHLDCKMESLGKPFCSVCKEGMIEKIHDLISPVESYYPASNNLSNLIFPLDFELSLIKTTPNTLESSWTLNGSNFANDVDDISLLETDLNIGINTLTATIHDATTFLRVDNHENKHISIITWTINYSALGIESIESTENELSISIFPNPSDTFINLKIESSKDANLKMDLLSIDGKKIKTIKLSNLEMHQLDISNLSKGVYLTNIYANNALIASKKIVKN